MRGSKQDPTDPCLDPNALDCGRGDHGKGNPVNGSLHANCRAAQGEVDPICIEKSKPTCEDLFGVGAPQCNPCKGNDCATETPPPPCTGDDCNTETPPPPCTGEDCNTETPPPPCTGDDCATQQPGCEPDCSEPPPPAPVINIPAAQPLTCPDWLLFHTFRDQNLEVYKLDGGALTNISNSPNTDSRPGRSLDSQWIVFQSNRGGTVQLFLVDSNGQNLKQLTKTGNNTNAMFGPDNHSVIYQSDRNGNWDIFVLDVATGNEKQLTTDPHSDTNPYWSPSADWITYQSDRTGNENVLVLNVQTGEEFSVTRTTVDTVFPTWSPNGRQLAFLTRIGGALYNLMVSNVDGGGFQQVTVGMMDTGNPAWSPQGDRLAYQAQLDGKLDIYTYDLASKRQYQVTGGEGVNSGPSWDCGGQRVAFTSTRSGSPNLLSAVWTGGPADFLTNDTSTNKWVLWSPTESDLASRAH